MLFGSDLSPKMLNKAKEKEIYYELEVCDMKEFPYKYNDNMFDVLICAGVLSYAIDDDFYKIFNEWNRIVKKDGIIIASQRTDRMDNTLQYFNQLIKENKWEKLEITNPRPYLPHNSNYDDIFVQLLVVKNK